MKTSTPELPVSNNWKAVAAVLVRVCLVAVLIILLLVSWTAWQFANERRKFNSEDPTAYEADVKKLERKSLGRYAAGEAIVFIGSSSISLWDSLEQDMSPLPVLRHGFGGAKINDIVYYADRLVSAYQPRAVVAFAGTNDITDADGKAPTEILRSVQAFVQRVRDAQPDVPIFYIGITPSSMRWEVWPEARTANRLIAAWMQQDATLFYIETSVGLLGDDGKPDKANYHFDGLHLNKTGYAVWREIIRPELMRVLAEPHNKST